MKTRNGFVSNSSSSSFIVIGQWADPNLVDTLKQKYGQKYGNNHTFMVSGTNGHLEFGWEQTRYSDFWSRLNFTFLQADYMRDTKPEWMKMLNRVLMDNLILKNIEWGITTEWDNASKNRGYIDHQSNATEGKNTEMFETEDTLHRFLFSKESYIQGDNDNH